MSFNKSKLALAVAAAAGLTFSSGAFATNGILQAGNGMVAHGLGGAGLSNAGEASAGMDNPALITQTGDSVNVAWSIFMPDRKIEEPASLGGQTVNSDSKMFGIPQLAFTSQGGGGLAWGLMAYAMGGMNTDYRTDPFGTPGSAPEGVNLQGMIIAPTLSYAFGKSLSVGASVLVGYETLTARNIFDSFPVTKNTFEDSSVGYGVKLGADFKITDGISVGGMVQPKLSMDELKGFKNFLNTNFGYTKDASIPLPNEAGIGAKFAVGKSVDILADIMYYQWTSVDVFKFFGWDDQTVYKLGVEFRPTESWALRAGLNYGDSPIKGGNQTSPIPAFGGVTADAAFANYLFPAISTTHITLGAGYKMDKNMTINGYYLYSPEASQTASTASFGGLVPAGTTIKMSQNAFGIGLNYATK